MHHKQSRQGTKEGQRDGTHPKRGSRSAPPATSGHHHRHKWRATTEAPAPSKLKYILNFALFGLRRSRENTKAHQKIIHFCPVLPKICPDGLKIDDQRGWRQAGRKPLCYMQKGYKRGTPPLFAERQEPFTPIIFRTIKIEKSSPTFGWKNFRKFFTGECFG